MLGGRHPSGNQWHHLAVYSWIGTSCDGISNITLVKAIKLAGPTLTSLFGALEPLTAVLIGVFVFKELFTVYSAMGIALIVVSVSLVVFQEKRKRV